jgi:LacI family transcriptional regulator
MEKSGNDAGRVTIKQVAQAAQVHYSTVSKALRGLGRIPPATRDRILQIAGEIGYQQDSVMQALAAQRSQCSGLHRETRIVFLSNRWAADDPEGEAFMLDSAVEASAPRSCERERVASAPRSCERERVDSASTAESRFMRQFADGVQHQAELMGCACDLLSVGDEKFDIADIKSRLDPARTDGIIIGAFDPLLRQLELEWSRYAVVKIDSAFMLPEATLVANDQLQIAQTAFRHACRLGYRRIGMAVGQAEEEATQSRYSAGYYVVREELGLPEIPILYCREHRDDPTATARRMVDWVREHRLEIVLSSWNSVREFLRDGGLQVPRDIACMCLCLNVPDPALAGVIQHHFVVGQKAAEALALLIMRRKRGLAMPSAATFVAGTWQDGASAPPRDSREP